MRLTDYQTKIIEGYTAEKPSVSGVYTCVCSETEYTPYTVAVNDVDGDLFVTDDEVGVLRIDDYSANLIGLLWLYARPINA